MEAKNALYEDSVLNISDILLNKRLNMETLAVCRSFLEKLPAPFRARSCFPFTAIGIGGSAGTGLAFTGRFCYNSRLKLEVYLFILMRG